MSDRKAKDTHAQQPRTDCRKDGAAASIRHLALPFLVVLAGVCAYANSFDGIFLFDDTGHILTTQRIRHLWPPWKLLAGRRPIVDLTLAINFAVSELNTWSYHALNLTVHILAALTLYGVVRRTALRLTEAATAPWLALTAALIFVVHPLQTQSVTYIIQRGESMMGLFYLLTLYCFIRGAEADAHDSDSKRVAWYVMAVCACALGMGSKAVMVTAPLMVLLYDRTFLAGSFVTALRARKFLYMGLAATWAVLGICGVLFGVLSPSREVATVGFSYKGITPIEYALTQFGTIMHYLRLALWPLPLCLDYEWPVAATWATVALPGLIVAGLLVGCFVLLRSRSWLGFVSAWFFLILAPTSSIVPIKDTLFEHRMYLALAGLVVLASICGYAVLLRTWTALGLGGSTRRMFAAALVAALVITGACVTHQRNTAYQSGPAMWTDVIAKRPTNARAYNNLGNAYLDLRKPIEAIKEFRIALRLRPRFAEAYNNLGKGLDALGKKSEAIEAYQNAIAVQPRFAQAHNNLGNALNDLGEHHRALEHFDAAIRLDPNYATAYNNRGLVYAHGLNDYPRAIQDYDQAIALNPLYAGTFYSRGLAYAGLDDLDRAMQDYDEAIRRDPMLPEPYYARGNVWRKRGKLDEAIAEFDRAIALDPNYTKAWFNRGLACDAAGRIKEAIESYRRYLQLAPPQDAGWIERTTKRIAHLQSG